MDEIRGSQFMGASQLVLAAACVKGCEAASRRIGKECCDQLVMSAVNTGGVWQHACSLCTISMTRSVLFGQSAAVLRKNQRLCPSVWYG